MPEPPFDREEVQDLLSALHAPKRLVFGLACSERLYPNYVAFAREVGWGDPEGLRAALDLAWDVSSGQAPRPPVAQNFRKRVHDAEPDTEEFGTILVSSALDAAVAVGLVLKMLEEESSEPAVEIASLCCDTVDMYVQALEHLEPSDDGFEDKILLHPLMQAELQRQRTDLRTLATVSWAPDEARLWRDSRREPELSNIGLLLPR